MQTLIKNEEEIIYLAVNKILPNPYQPRKIFNSTSLDNLVKSIKTQGLIKPLTVRCLNDDIYELISGERRLKACKILGFKKVPTIIKDFTSKESVLFALTENIQREDLNFFEEAETFQKLMVDFGYSIEDISNTLGLKKNYILEKLSLLSLKKELKQIIIENNFNESQALCLLKIDDFSTQKEILDKMVKYNLNLYQTNKLVDSTLAKLKGESLKKTQRIKGFIRDIRIFTNTIKNSVEIMQQSGIKTDYSIIKNEDSYNINIKINMKN